jgi:hypothetical protein
MSKVLIGLITLLMAVIPWSEHYNILDSFPRTQDAELSLLAFFVILGMILLFVRASKKGLHKLLSFAQLLLSKVRLGQAAVPSGARRIPVTDADHPPHSGASLETYNLPLQI